MANVYFSNKKSINQKQNAGFYYRHYIKFNNNFKKTLRDSVLFERFLVYNFFGFNGNDIHKRLIICFFLEFNSSIHQCK